MAAQTFEKVKIAKTQLLTALKLYLEGNDYFSVITLAGASEEILGKTLTKLGTTNALEQRQQSVKRIARQLLNHETTEKRIAEICNRARNAMKHLGAGCAPDDSTVTFDPKTNAEDILERAIENLECIEPFEFTPEIQNFYRRIL